MSFWSKIGLASHKELKEMKDELSAERAALGNEIRDLFREQQASQEKAIENLKKTFEQSLGGLEVAHKNEVMNLSNQIRDTRNQVSEQLLVINEMEEGVSHKVETLQEIAKVHWASNLLDYIDELLDEVADQHVTDGDVIHPLDYDFGEISNLYKFICDGIQRVGLYVGWRNTKQTVQIYLKEEDGETYQNQIGAIQYEGSNDFFKKPPHTVSLRFIINNMPKKMVRDLSTILSKEQASKLLSGNQDTIVFKFNQVTPETRVKIKKIFTALRKSMLLVR